MHRENFTVLLSSKYLENHTPDVHRKGLVITSKYPILAKTEMYQYIIVKLKIKFHEHLFSVIKVLLPTDEQENCFERSIKTYVETAPTCFGVITIIRERTQIVRSLMMVITPKHVRA